MLKIGLTGGIGSGKTTVAKVFETLGIPVYYADDAAKRLMNTNPELKERIIKTFGKESYTGDELNRKYLASVVFNDKEKLDTLNAITHPATIQDADDWIKKQKSPYIIKEAALLFESGAAAYLDAVIGVDAPQSIRINRVMNRDNITEVDVMKRIAKQMDEETKMKKCQYLITNNDEQLVIPQIIELHHKLLTVFTS